MSLALMSPDSPGPQRGKKMSALGKHVLEGDFDHDGQVVVQTPVERVIERSVVVTRTVTEVPKPAPAIKAEAPRHSTQPPLPYPLAPRPAPADLTLDRAPDALLTPSGKAPFTDRYPIPDESFQDMFPRASCPNPDNVEH